MQESVQGGAPQSQEMNVEIVLINHKPSYSEKFDWQNFRPEAVASPEDLPPYLCLGYLNCGDFLLTDDGWSSLWENKEQKAKLRITFNKKTNHYSLMQSWQGIEGSTSEASGSEPFPTVVGTLYQDGFPKSWNEKAPDYFDSKFQVSWISIPPEMPLYFGLPDGVFFNITFPIMVKNIKTAQGIFESMLKEEPASYGFFVTATMVDQKIAYKAGVAPEWTKDLAQVLTQSIGETGLVPLSIPEVKQEQDGQYVEFERSVVMLNISVPFVYLEDMLRRLSETPMPFYLSTEPLHRRETLPIILPTSIFDLQKKIRLNDMGQGVSCEYQFFPTAPLEEMMKKDPQKEIDNLEKTSEALINQIIEQAEGK